MSKNKKIDFDELEKEEYIFQARVAIDSAQDIGNGLNRFKIAGALICPAGQPDISETDQWEGIQCEVIIRPIKRMGTNKIKNIRMDHAAMALGDDRQWTKKKDDK